MQKEIKTAVFPVAGMGTRFLPATKAMPKEMLTIVDKPIIQYAVEEAKNAGIEKFIFVTGKGKTAIEDHFDYSYELHDVLKKRGKEHIWEEKIASFLPQCGKASYIRQSTALGLGHAVLCARDLVGDKAFAVLLADDIILSPNKPCLAQMLDCYEKGSNIIAVSEVADDKVSSYGILDPINVHDRKIRAKGIVEKPDLDHAPSRFGVTGRYILQPEIFDHLAEGKTGSGGEIQLTDAIDALLAKQSLIGVLYEGERFDCGSHQGFIEANLAFAMKDQHLAKRLKPTLEKHLKSL